ncbi:S1 family peptidase [Nocardiopsis aegyptia]|uniref:S1 family peptidase n=1 Tax=Nocardiopsis aegyptia TaxID=220378 RepID=UPI00366DAAFF
MSFHSKRLFTSVIAGSFFLSGLPSAASAQEASTNASPPTESTAEFEIPSGDALVTVSDEDIARAAELGNADAAPYAAEHGISLEEAVERLRVQEAVGSVSEELSLSLGEDDAGTHIEHTPRFRVVVGTSGDDEDVELPAALTALDVPVDIVEREHSLADIQRDRESVQAELEDEGIEFDSYENVIDNNAVIEVVGESSAAEEIASEAAPLSLSGPPTVAIRSVDEPAETESGGLALTSCTAGFVVVRSGTRLLSTAAHCSNTQRLVTSDIGLGYVTGTYGNYYDAQVHSAPGVNLRNRIYTGTGSTNYRDITSRRSRADISVGDYVCKRGKTTEYGCSYVASKTVRTSAVPSSHATFIGMQSHITDGGDSGGPWFNGYTAIGIHHGRVGSMSVFMSVSFLGGATGASILTS